MGYQADVVEAMDYADIIGSAFDPDAEAISGGLDSLDRFVRFVNLKKGIPSEHINNANLIKKKFVDMHYAHSQTIEDCERMVDNLMEFKELGMALAQKLDNQVHIKAGQQPPHSKIKRKYARLEDKVLAGLFLRAFDTCNLPEREALAGRLTKLTQDWHDLTSMIEKEVETLRQLGTLTDDEHVELDKQVSSLRGRMCVLTGAVVLLGCLTGGAGFAAAPLLAGGLGVAAVVTSAFAGLTLAAKGVALQKLGSVYKRKQAIQSQIDAGEGACEMTKETQVDLEDVLEAVTDHKMEADRLKETMHPVLKRDQQKSWTSLTSIPKYARIDPEIKDVDGVIGQFNSIVQEPMWKEQRHWEQDISKLYEVSTTIRKQYDRQNLLKSKLTK